MSDRPDTAAPATTPSPVTLINVFEVPAGREDEFFGVWKAADDYMHAQPGYLWNRLHRSLSMDVRFRFINVAEWQSPAHFQAAVSTPAFRGLSEPLRAFTFYPALYEIVSSGDA